MTRPTQVGEQWVGQSVDGRYPLHKCVSSSEQSAVFLTQIGGEQGAKAVIKLMMAESCDPEAQLALWRRAAKLSHPSLIRILDGGRCSLNGSDLIFLVSEYAEENLGEVLPRRALTPAECNALLRPMLAVLKYIHEQGLVHGRLRPSNVMAVNEQLKISSDCIRPAGEIKASAAASAYDAPELRNGKISSASDVWSLGAILVEALAHKAAAQNGAEKNLPKPFGEIVRHSLREDPASRWTLPEIESCLTGAVAGGTSTASAKELSSSMRRYLPLILAGVLLLIVAAIYGLVRGGGDRRPAAVATSSPPAEPATAKSTPPAPAVSNAALAASAQSNANSAGAVLHQVSPAASPSSLRTIHGRLKVRVRVDVDAAGNVTREKLVTPGPSRYFSRLAMEAAQQWKFAPVQNGSPSPTQWTILFEYTRGGISNQATMSAR